MQAIATRLTRFSLAFALLLCTPAAHGKDLSSDSEAAGWRAQAFQQSLKGEKDEALESYQKAVDTALRDYGPDSSYIGDLYYEMGTLALDAKKTHKAEVYLQKAVQQNPNSIMGRVKYSEALELVGRKDEAYQQIQAALAKHKNSPEAREALVLWWQSKAKEDGLTKQAKSVYQSRAFQESAILGQSLRGPASVVTPSQTMVASAAAKPVEAAKLAASAPATKPEGFNFPWAMKPKTEPAKKEEKPAPKPTAKKEEKPAAKAKEVKKAEPKQEPKKKGKKAKAESAPKQSAPTQPLQLKAEPKPALVTSAKQLPKPKAESPKKADTEEIQAPDQPPPKKEEPKKEQPKPVAQPPARGFVPVVDLFPKNMGKPKKGGLVPPPPPMTPIFPGSVPYYQPPPQAVQPAPKAEPKPKPKAKEPAKESESKSSGNSEDPDFILEWAGKKKK